MNSRNFWISGILMLAVLIGLAGGPAYSQAPGPTSTPAPASPTPTLPMPATEPPGPSPLPNLPEERSPEWPPEIRPAGVDAQQTTPYRYFLFSIGAQAPVGQFNYPLGVAVAPDGSVYVVDSNNCRIQRFSATGTFLNAWGSCGSEEGKFSHPYGVAVASDGTVYVADTYNHRIQRFSATGAFLGKWGSYGSGEIGRAHV